MLSECWNATLLWSKIVLCAHLEYNVALHVDTTPFATGTYEISQKSAKDIFEDQVNITKGLSEAPNQSSEDNNTNIPDSSPTSKVKPRT
jgi:predicted metallo-beta-lactamase superfamily hydrolase